MKNVQIRNVPDRVHRVLVRRAAAEGRSLQEYLLRVLEEEARPTVEEVLRRASSRSGGRVGFEQAVEDLRSEREERESR